MKTKKTSVNQLLERPRLWLTCKWCMAAAFIGLAIAVCASLTAGDRSTEFPHHPSEAVVIGMAEAETESGSSVAQAETSKHHPDQYTKKSDSSFNAFESEKEKSRRTGILVSDIGPPAQASFPTTSFAMLGTCFLARTRKQKTERNKMKTCTHPSRALLRIFGAVAAALCIQSTAQAAAPANDNFANATVLSPTWTTATGSNVDASGQTGEPRHTDLPATGPEPTDANAPDASVWWSWTPNFSGSVRITTAGSTTTIQHDDGVLDTQLAVYTGSSVSALTLVARNEDSPLFQNGLSHVDFNVVAGTTYRIAVDAWREEGSIKLNRSGGGSVTPPPSGPSKYVLSTSVVPAGAGVITLDPPQPSGGYTSGTVVTVSVTPNGTNVFSTWTGAASGSGSSTTITMNARKSATAVFNSNNHILFQHGNTRQLAVWLLQNTTYLTGATVANGNPVAPGWNIVTTGDFDNNGSSDLVFQHNDRRLAVWFMNGNSYLSAALLRSGARVTPGWRVVGTGDFNTNGTPDILFQRNDGVLAVWFMDGTDYVNSSLIHGGAATGAWRAVGVGDMNGDGQADIIFKHPNGRTAIWLMNGTALDSSVSGKNAGNWKLVGLTDFNGNNTTDFLWQHGDGRLAVWFMNGTTFGSSTYIRGGQSSRPWQAKGAE